MLSDRDALLAAIRSSPEEDTPRLMFADWLDERGGDDNAARAEFIRLQCELARLADDGGESQPLYEFVRDRDWVSRPSADWPRIDEGIHRRIALALRAEDLARRHGEAWLPKLPKKYRVEWVPVQRGWESSRFRRGFPHRVTLGDLRKLKPVAARLREAAPAVTLVTDGFTPEAVEQLADAGLLGWVRGLEVLGDCEAALREFGHRPEAALVRSLAVRRYYGVEAGVAAALADAPHWTGLHALDLSETRIAAEDAAVLFGAPHLRSLRRLSLNGAYDWSEPTARALAASGFANLTGLRLGSTGAADEVAEALAGCAWLKGLRMLDLPHGGLSGRGVTALLCSPHLANVAFLGLEGNPCDRVDAKRLAAADPGALRMFHAHGCRLRTADVRALARCPRLRNLWYLDLDDNNLTAPAVRELVRGLKDRCPPILWLTHNRIDDRGAQLLADWQAAQAMSVLHLRYNPITDAGVEALLASNYLANLDGLGVDTDDPDLRERLRHRFRHFDNDTGYG
jgi:uncharacterized protein (TIGR02996 family)